VLLLDEPASGLDPEARAALAGVLRALRQDGMTIIVSSHILAELQDYSTHMLIVDGGRIVEHRALGAEVPADARQRVVVVLAAPDPRLGEVLSRQEGLTEIDSDGARAGFVMAADADRRQAVLRALMDAGLSVAEFGLERQSLQDAYLARMGRKGEGA
jgi:ABC-2 type transport system ATP-binding protein